MDTTAIERVLLALGFDPGPVDGKPGPKTKAAVQGFQKSRGLHVDGIVAPKTEAALKAAGQGTSAPAAGVSITQPRATRRITEIIHSPHRDAGRAHVSVDTIRGWHIGQGWRDIGYHWIVLLDGTVEPGRPEAQLGSHVLGHNTGTLGVVYVGGVAADGKTENDTRTAAQKRAALLDLRVLITRYPTVTQVTGHNQ